MSLFSNIKNVLKVNNGLPVPIKSGTRIVDGDTGVEYEFDGKHWKRVVMNASTRPADVAAPPGSSMFPRGLDISSNITSNPRRTRSSSNNDSDTFVASAILYDDNSVRSSSSDYSSSASSWSSDSSCSSSSSDSGGGSCD
jgi:hypothetical protein